MILNNMIKSLIHALKGYFATRSELKQKQDKIAGKDLSTNDYTDADKSKVAISASLTYVDNEINDIQGQIDALVSKSDVVDIVDTYADLQNYDTSGLGNRDVVKVLNDSTHSDQRTYYRWIITDSVSTWVYVGSESVGYTKAQTDAFLNDKLDTDGDGSNVTAVFTTAVTRDNISTGEKLSVIFSKIKKWFADLKPIAFTANYNDLINTPTPPVVNDATLTIKQGGHIKGVFSANANTAVEIDLDAGGGSNYVAQAEAPEDTSVLWIDSDDDSGSVDCYTKTESDSRYPLKDDLDDYVAIAQDVANVNKVLAVGADGNVTVKAITEIIADGDEVSY